MLYTIPPPPQIRAAPRPRLAARAPDLELHVSRSGHMITVTTSVAAGAEGRLAVAETGNGGLGSWAVAGSAEKFTGIAPGSWTLTVTFSGTGGWATQTVTKRVAAH